MSESAARLYTPEMLALAVSLAEYPLHDSLQLRAGSRSKTCGSTLELGLSLDDQDRVSEIGMQVSACAVGQASAALFARSLKGMSLTTITATRDRMADWLAGSGELPDCPGIAMLDPARAFPARHNAIMLPWNAACEALCKAEAAR